VEREKCKPKREELQGNQWHAIGFIETGLPRIQDIRDGPWDARAENESVLDLEVTQSWFVDFVHRGEIDSNHVLVLST
jgi:hypothetical protein